MVTWSHHWSHGHVTGDMAVDMGGHMTGHMGSHMTVHMTGHVTGDMTVHMTGHMTGHMGGHMTDRYVSITYPLLFLQWEPSLFEGSTVVAHPEGTAVLTIGAHVFLMRGKRSLAFTHTHHTHTHTHTHTPGQTCTRVREQKNPGQICQYQKR